MSRLLKVPKNEYLYKQGDPATAMYMVKSGSFTITRFILHEEVGPGSQIYVDDIIGELSLFDGKHRDHNIKATQDSEVVVLEYSHLLKNIEDLPPWAEALMKTMISHLRAVAQYVRTRLEKDLEELARNEKGRKSDPC